MLKSHIKMVQRPLFTLQIKLQNVIVFEEVAPPEEGNHCMFLSTSVRMPPNYLSHCLLPEQVINRAYFPCLLESFRQTRPNRRERTH